MQRQNNCIYYWEGILDPNNLVHKYNAVIQKIKNGEFRGLNFKKLRGHHVYSVRVNDTHRLLFSTVQVRGVSYLMLLDEVLNHDYDKSAFLKPSVLKNYLEMHGEAIQTEVSETCFEEETCVLDLPVSSGEVVVYKPAEFFKRKFIDFNTDQTAITMQATLPLVISGAAGSGKSCVALSMLSHYAAKHMHDFVKPIVYITESEKLCQSMRAQWQCLPISQKDEKGMVRFLTYRQLLCELKPELTKWEISGKNECIDHIRSVIREKKILNKLEKLEVFNPQFYDSVEAMYQEWRIISGYTSKEEYLKLGDRQSLFKDKVLRAWLFDQFYMYVEDLKLKSIYNPAFFQLECEAAFELMVVDETQDFSFRQIDNLNRLAEGEQICFCEDSRQSLADNVPKKTYFDKLLDAKHNRNIYRELRQSYRCPAAVVKLAGAVSELSIKTTHQRLPSKLELAAGISDGSAILLTSLDESALKVFKSDAESPDFAIVTRAEFKNEAKERFHTELIFTPEEIKGLEYKKVMIYRLMAHEVYYQLNRCMTDGFVNGDQTGLEVVTALNALYTACTRSTEEIVLVEDLKSVFHKLENIIGYLQKSCKDRAKRPENSSVENKSHSKKQWYDEAVRQLQEGNIVLAKQIISNRLGYTAHQIDAFVKDYFPPEISHVGAEVQSQPAAIPSTRKKKKKKKKTTGAVESQSGVLIDNEEILAEKQAQKINLKISEDDVRYIKGLLKKPTMTNLQALFTHKKASLYLFHPILENGSCLFTRLFDTPQSRNALFACLPKYIKQFAKEITTTALSSARPREAGAEANSSPLYWLAAIDVGQNILTQLFANNEKLVRNITAEDICRTLPLSAGQFAGSSALYWFGCSSEGRVIFKQLLDGNPALACQITGDALCRPLPNVVGRDANSSVLLGLSCSSDGCVILARLLESNRELAGQITGVALCRPLPEAAGSKANASVLLGLSSSSEGRSILMRLLEGNSELSGQITGDALCRPLPHLAGSPDTINYALICLCDSPDGLSILNLLLTSNPKLASQITAEALCRTWTPDGGPKVKLSVLLKLSTTSEGLSVLDLLLEGNPKLGGQITIEALCRVLPRAASTIANFSVLLGLSSHSLGHTILERLLDSNEDLARHLTGEVLCRPMPHSAGPNENRSVILGLSGKPKGHAILRRLLDARRELAANITGEALCRPLTQAAEEGENESALYWLSEITDGRLILKQLLDGNPKLAGQITGEALCRTLPQVGHNVNHSVLFHLSNSSLGLSILKRLFEGNLNLAGQISGVALCRPVSDEGAGYVENESALYWLSTFSEGRSILLRLLETNRELASQITAEAICCPLTQPAGDSVLLWLSSVIDGNTDGCTILTRLLDGNSQLAGQITGEALCRALPEAAGSCANLSALYGFCSCPEGRLLINRLLDGNPQLAGQITGEVLCRALPQSSGVIANASVLLCLSETPLGHSIFNRLLDANPALASQITAEALCRSLTKAAGDYENDSSLYLLSQSIEGIAILKGLIKKNPQLADQIDADALFRSGKANGGGISSSAYSFLSQSEEGRSVLQLLPDSIKLAASTVTNTLQTIPGVASALNEVGIFANNDRVGRSPANNNIEKDEITFTQ